MLAGRERLLEAFDVVSRRADQLGEGDRSWVINGLRGVGKTVLLNELMRQTSQRRWIVAKIEASRGAPLNQALAAELVKSLRTATGRHPDGSRLRRALGALKSFSLSVGLTGASFGVDVEPLNGVADSGRWGDDLAALFGVLGEASRDYGIGTLVLVDELQEADAEELEAINRAVHEIGQADVPAPVVFVGAGLPSLPAQLADASSYAERLYAYQPLDLLEGAAVEEALVEPARAQDADWAPEALEAALDLVQGYPYFVQSVGKHVWDLAPGPVIQLDDVTQGGILARQEVDAGLYRSRWERATSAQRRLLMGMAELRGDDSVEIGELAAHLGRNRTSDLSVARQELIRKGLVYAPERGLIAFTVPGMAHFVLQQEA